MSLGQSGLTIQCKVHFTQVRHGRKKMAIGDAPSPAPAPPLGRVPRLARLMALAIRFETLLRQGEVRDYAELARLGHVTRARVTQIMNLLNLATDIQEEMLFMPSTLTGRDRVKEWEIRPIAAELHWAKQRRLWHDVKQIR